MVKIGYKQSEEHQDKFRDNKGRFIKGVEKSKEFMKKVSQGMMGHKISKETKDKISKSQKGIYRWDNDGKKILREKTKMAWIRGDFNEERNKKISISLKLQHQRGDRKESYKKIGLSNKGYINKKISERNKLDWKRKEYRIKKSGENHYNWKGGITSINKKLRISSKWKIWRELIYLRDNFTCQNKGCKYCNNKIGVILHPHHIKPISLYPELAFRIDNGITYCFGFHIKSGLHKNILEVIENVPRN